MMSSRYESDMLNTGSPMTLGLIAGIVTMSLPRQLLFSSALTYPITWRSVSRMHLFRNRPVIPQFLAIVLRPIQPYRIRSVDSLQVPPVAFLYIAGVYNCRMVMSRLVWPESYSLRMSISTYRCIVRENGLVEHEMSSTSTERRHQ